MLPRSLTRLLAVAALATVGLLSPTAAYATDTNCEDYPNRAAAQADFDAHGGSAVNNWHGLDNDHDGKVCEHHVYPTPTGTAAPTPSPTAAPTHPATTPGTPPVSGPPAEELPITGARTQALTGGGVALVLLGSGVLIALRRRRVS